MDIHTYTIPGLLQTHTQRVNCLIVTYVCMYVCMYALYFKCYSVYAGCTSKLSSVYAGPGSWAKGMVHSMPVTMTSKHKAYNVTCDISALSSLIHVVLLLSCFTMLVHRAHWRAGPWSTLTVQTYMHSLVWNVGTYMYYTCTCIMTLASFYRQGCEKNDGCVVVSYHLDMFMAR